MSIAPANKLAARSAETDVASLTGPLQVPYFNAPIYLENISQIGKVDEILGAITNVVSDTTLALHLLHVIDVLSAWPFGF